MVPIRLAPVVTIYLHIIFLYCIRTPFYNRLILSSTLPPFSPRLSKSHPLVSSQVNLHLPIDATICGLASELLTNLAKSIQGYDILLSIETRDHHAQKVSWQLIVFLGRAEQVRRFQSTAFMGLTGGSYKWAPS